MFLLQEEKTIDGPQTAFGRSTCCVLDSVAAPPTGSPCLYTLRLCLVFAVWCRSVCVCVCVITWNLRLERRPCCVCCHLWCARNIEESQITTPRGDGVCVCMCESVCVCVCVCVSVWAGCYLTSHPLLSFWLSTASLGTTRLCLHSSCTYV